MVLGRTGGPSRWPGRGRDARRRGSVQRGDPQADLGTGLPLEQADAPSPGFDGGPAFIL